MKVAVIVDDLDPNRRRRCFWEEQLAAIPDVEYELVSLLHQMEERKFFDVYAFDVVIFNWCVLDGSLMYASDRVQCIVEFYDDHFVQFVRRGGVVIMENQPKRWRPSQKAYDVLLPGEFVVAPKEPHFFSSKAIVNPRLRSHPLVQHLPPTLESAYKHPVSESWFPPDSTSARSIQELHPTKIYSGAFREWDPEWLPLIYTEDMRYPILLAKTDGLGLWVVTTMYLASSNIQELLHSLIVGSRRHDLAVRAFHARQKTVRRWHIARASAIVIGVALAIYAALTADLFSAKVPYGDTVLGDVLFSIAFAILVAAATFLRKYIRSAIRNARNR